MHDVKNGYTIEEIDSSQEMGKIKQQWDEIVLTLSSSIIGLDFSSLFSWIDLLQQTHGEIEHKKVLVLREQGSVVGFFPVYYYHKRAAKINARFLAPITELYSNRPGFILRQPKLEHLSVMLDYLFDEKKSWDIFELTLVDGSASQKLFLEYIEQRGLYYALLSQSSTPYMHFEKKWDQYFAGLAKKFRWLVRSNEEKLRQKGRLTFKHFHHENLSKEVLNVILDIEQESWKEGAGTSISRNEYQKKFYTKLLSSELDNCWASVHLLFLDDEPIAYILGVNHNGVFADLKESYKEKYKEYSPGHVLKRFAFEELINYETRVYDFCGLAESYKMKWASTTYSKSTYLVYNRTVRARAAKIIGVNFKSISRKLAKRAAALALSTHCFGSVL